VGEPVPDDFPEIKKKRPDRLRIPPDLPGADAPPIPPLPSLELPQPKREVIIRQRFPALEPLGADPEPMLPKEGRPWTLADLQALAAANSPLLRRAAADVEAARGAAVQAGLYPNPIVGYEADQVQPGPKDTNNAGQQGAYFQQVFKLWGKLDLARCVALMDLRNAEVALRRAQLDLAGQVRAGYFAVLVARENVVIARALAQLSDESYQLQQQLVLGGPAAFYEPLQLYVQSAQARSTLAQARNRYSSAWKQLAATLGLPVLPPTRLAGRADTAPPRYDYSEALARVLARHTDILTAENAILRADYNLRLQKRVPWPDLNANLVLQHDNAAGNDQFNLQLGIPVPVFDRNQGNIYQAKAQLGRAYSDLEATRNDLASRLADAFERYDNGRVLLANFRERILPNQVRVYRALRQRYQQEVGTVSFGDIVAAQQTLGGLVTTYLSALSDHWSAVVGVATLLQVDDLYGGDAKACEATRSLAEEITALPRLPMPQAAP
jgi:cobalt-zinc-cadmium efflux system outer membrane protein